MPENFLNYKKLNFRHTSTKNTNLKTYKIYSRQTTQKNQNLNHQPLSRKINITF